MLMATAVSLYSTSPRTVPSPQIASSHFPSSHCASSSSEIEIHPRVLSTHHAHHTAGGSCKPVLGGLSSLFASPAVRYSSCTATDIVDATLPLARRGSHPDLCALWDGNENWSDALAPASSSSKIRERSPVSVLQGPLSFSYGQSPGRFTMAARDRGSNGSLYEASTSDRKEIPARERNLNVNLYREDPATTLTDLDFCTEMLEIRQGTPRLMKSACSSISEFFCKPLFPETLRTTHDILRNAQKRHEIFKDPFVIKAFEEAEQAHYAQFRADGDPYLVHCVETAIILAAIGANKVVVAAGLLHDTIDDSPIDHKQLGELFGVDVADLVQGVSRLSEFSKLARDNNTAYKTVEADRLHTMFLSMADVRVVLIKLADRLHNMRTLGALPSQKQCRIAKETLEVFVPLASRLGVWSWKAEMEDLCFKHLKHREHQELAIKLAEGFREATIMSAIQKLYQALMDRGVQYHDLCGRPKNLYSIYSKMMRKGRSVNEIYDVQGLRLIVANERDCYTALETVHQLWSCVPGKVKDYISQPKLNGYQSLHTVVWGEDGLPLEIQIRTKEMHYQAEFGVAAHWRYKEANVPHSSFILQKVEWARWVLTWQNEIMDTKLRLSRLDVDLRPPCPFPIHKDGCPHSELFHGPPQHEDDPLFVIVLEEEKMMVQELLGGSTVADLLLRRADEDSLAATSGFAFSEELRPRVNHKEVDDIQQRLKMGDLVEVTPFIPGKSLSEYREKIKRMFGDCALQEDKRRHTMQPSWTRTSELAVM